MDALKQILQFLIYPMKVIKTLIVDDERLARVSLKKLLESYSEINIIGEADTCKNALDLIKSHKPDLIFLDIELADETGFNLLESIENNFKVIFVTAYDEYAIRAFEVNAADYLLKPVNPERLKIAINRISNTTKEEKEVKKKYEYSDSIYVKLNNSTSNFIKINSIITIESVGNYSRIITAERKSYIILKTLKQWEEELPDKSFKRIHRSTIINFEYINRIEKYSKNIHKVYLTQIEEPLEISRRFAGKLKNLN